MKRKSKLAATLVLALTIFVVSPLDDLVFAAVFGGVLFGFGSVGFFVVLSATTCLSTTFWLKHRKHPAAVQKPITSKA